MHHRGQSLRRDRFLTGAVPADSQGPHPDITWSGLRLEAPDWHLPGARLLAATIAGREVDEPLLHMVFNMDDSSHAVRLPAGTWDVLLDTSRPSPEDINPPAPGRQIRGRRITVRARSVVALELAGTG